MTFIYICDIMMPVRKDVVFTRLKDGFLLRQIAGEHVVLPVGEGLDQNMMITLNDTGAFLWERLQEDTSEDALVQALLDTYDVTESRARACVTDFIQHLTDKDFLA